MLRRTSTHWENLDRRRDRCGGDRCSCRRRERALRISSEIKLGIAKDHRGATDSAVDLRVQLQVSGADLYLSRLPAPQWKDERTPTDEPLRLAVDLQGHLVLCACIDKEEVAAREEKVAHQ